MNEVVYTDAQLAYKRILEIADPAYVVWDKMRPKCANLGCNTPAKHSRTNALGIIRFSPFCKHCEEAYREMHPFKKGVTPIKTHTCSNADGHLGWPCVTRFDLFPEWLGNRGKTQMDHINCISMHNHPANLQELCVYCHQAKTYGNKNTNRYTSEVQITEKEFLQLSNSKTSLENLLGMEFVQTAVKVKKTKFVIPDAPKIALDFNAYPC